MTIPLYNSSDGSTPLDWLKQDALIVAPQLLGCELVSNAGEGITGGRIVEVEVYHGAEDPASHAFRGRTPRTAPMFEAGGAIYVYRSYGIHLCLNIVTGGAEEAQAILIRALEPTRGLDLMAERRRTSNPRLLTSGPGKLGQALGLDISHSGRHLGDGLLDIMKPAAPIPAEQIITKPRIGIKVATERPWRFYLRGNPYVSRP